MELLKKMMLATSGGIELVGSYYQMNAGQTGTVSVDLTSLTGGIDTAPSENDIVILTQGSPSAGGTQGLTNPPAGWTLISQVVSDDLKDVSLTLSYKVMGATPDTSVDIESGGHVDNPTGATVFVFRGVDNSSPMDVTVQSQAVLNTCIPDPMPITPVTNGAVIFVSGIGCHESGVQTFTSSDLDNFISGGIDDRHDLSVGSGIKVWNGGEFNPSTYTYGGTDSTNWSNCVATIALRPA